jgi:hypothetical protein
MESLKIEFGNGVGRRFGQRPYYGLNVGFGGGLFFDPGFQVHSSLDCPGPMPFERVTQLLSVRMDDTPTAHYNQIQSGQLFLPESKALPDNPFYPVSVDGPFQYFFRYCHSQAGT